MLGLREVWSEVRWTDVGEGLREVGTGGGLD